MCENEETQVWVLSTFLLSSGSILFSAVTFEVFHFTTFHLAPDSRLSLCACEICKHSTVSGIISDHTGTLDFVDFQLSCLINDTLYFEQF